MIRPLQGCVLVRVIPQTKTFGGLEIPQRRKSPAEVEQDNHEPTPPPPDICEVMAIGAWKRLENGLAVPPPFPAGATVLVREGSGTKLNRNVGERLKLVRTEDVLAVLS